MIIYLSLGSNLGDRSANIEDAKKKLEKANVSVLMTSHLYETEPVGPPQPWFFNQIILAQTELQPTSLLATIKKIEKEAGRDIFSHGSSSTPRPIDIDILFYGDQVIEESNLAVPHPRLHMRRFVLVPFVEIAPDFIHPKLNKSMKVLLNECKDGSIVRRVA